MPSEVQSTINELLIQRLDLHADWLKTLGDQASTIIDRLEVLEERLNKLDHRSS